MPRVPCALTLHDAGMTHWENSVVKACAGSQHAAHLEDLVEAAADVGGRHLAEVQRHRDGGEGHRDAQQDAPQDEHGQIRRRRGDDDADVEQDARQQHRPLPPPPPVEHTSDMLVAIDVRRHLVMLRIFGVGVQVVLASEHACSYILSISLL